MLTQNVTDPWLEPRGLDLLAGAGVPRAMLAAFAADGDLGERLVMALRAGLVASGEAGPVRSAGLLVVDRVAWPVADLPVDWHADPIGELTLLWPVWQPQMAACAARLMSAA